MDDDGLVGNMGVHDPREHWAREQEMLKRKLKLYDDFPWQIGSNSFCGEDSSCNSGSLNVKQIHLRYIGGVDLSFSKNDPSIACAGIVIMDISTMSTVYEDFNIVRLSLPYIPGFLAFRESPVLLELLRRLTIQRPTIYPQVLMVDGNGILHPRGSMHVSMQRKYVQIPRLLSSVSGFGLASQLGVLADIPTIGVAKNLHHVDGLTRDEVRMAFDMNKEAKDVPLIGKSGQIWGTALRSHNGCQRPIFVSIGHRISLQTALNCVRMCCKYRIPEPIRQADMRSRGYLCK